MNTDELRKKIDEFLAEKGLVISSIKSENRDKLLVEVVKSHEISDADMDDIDAAASGKKSAENQEITVEQEVYRTTGYYKRKY